MSRDFWVFLAGFDTAAAIAALFLVVGLALVKR